MQATQTMGERRVGTVHWIDHFVTCTNDIHRWVAFQVAVLGAVPWAGFPEAMRSRGMFLDLARCRIGAFVADDPLPPTRGLGTGLPQYGFYVQPADLDAHVRRLDEAGAVHGAPVRISTEGDAGTSVAWQDPDGNQFAFWAPDRMPEGAITDCGPLRVGRISHAVFESRDLERTAAMFARYCALEAEPGTDADVLVLRLGAGGRIVFRKVDTLQGRTTGCGLPDAHTALLVHTDDFFANYARLWAELPEWDFDPFARKPIANPGSLEPRTVLHPTPAGKRLKALTQRGDDFFDWDTNMFHFYGGTPVGDSLAVYQGHSMDYYLKQLETDGKLDTLRTITSS